MKVWGHTLVRNEEKYLWFAVTSVIDYVDKLLLWDTGSTDNTIKIIEHLKNQYPDKILFKQVGEVNADDFTKVRQQMLAETRGDWFLILDGDEVWWDETISEIRRTIDSSGNQIESIVSRSYSLVGDIFHYQDEKSGKYNIDNHIGHINIRATSKKIPGLAFSKPHGQQGLIDGNGVLIQERDPNKRIFIERPAYLHFTHLVRSKSIVSDRSVIKRGIKFKYELGKAFNLDYFFPEVFFRQSPHYINSPWAKRRSFYILTSLALSPLRMVKRKLIKGRSGY